MNIHLLNAGYFKLDGGAMFGVIPKKLWSRHNPADENNLCNWAMRCLLIEDGDRLILVDTGIGDKQDEKFFGHYHLSEHKTGAELVAMAGFTAEDVTDVLLTHLHFDHCGGAVIRKDGNLIPAFPNATYWSNERHWKWATEPNDREKASFLKENIMPLLDHGKLRFIQVEEGVKFTDHISIRFAWGHTDAMMLPQFDYRGRTVVYMADLLPSAAHIPQPWVMAYDMFPLTTMQEKKGFLEEAAAKDYILTFEHDPAIACCTVQSTEKGFKVKETFEFGNW